MATIYRGIERTVALDPAVQAELRSQAEAVAARARNNASGHSDSGDYAASMGVSHGKVDWYAESTDPNAVSKEFGRTGGAGTPNHGPSEGVYALIRAANGEG